MRSRTPIILFIILIILTGGIYFLSKYQEKKKEEENRFVKLSEAVQRVEIKRRDGTDLIFENLNGRWRMRKPKDVAADNYVLERIADEVKDLKYEKLVDEKPADLRKYGLKDPEITLKIWERGSTTPLEILVGDKNPLNSDRYAKLKEDSKVVILSSIFTDLLIKEPMEYREKKIAKFDEDKVQKIEVLGKETSYTLIKKGEDWWLPKPVKALADNYKCDDLLYTITGSEAKEFVSDSATEEKIKEYGLENPDLTVRITLKGKKKPIELKISKKDDRYYVLRDNSIYRVEDSLYKTLAKQVKELREKRLVRFYSFDVKRFTWNYKGKIFEAIEEKDQWKALKPFSSALKKDNVEGFLRTIEDLEAEDFIDNPAGFKPEATIKFTLEKGKTVTVHLGEMNGKTVGREKGLGYLLVLNKKLSDIFPDSPESWKEEKKEEEKK